MTIPTATLDRVILRILENIEAPGVEHEVDILIRLGALRGRAVTVERAAQRLGTSAHWLSMALRSAGAPTAAALLTWGRIIAVMHAWAPSATGRSTRASLVSVARRVGWSDGFVFSRRFYYHTGVHPTTWGKSGGDFDHLVDLFVARWRGVHALSLKKRRREAVA